MNPVKTNFTKVFFSKDILAEKLDDCDLSKENNSFICLVNPPRHGKSLLLDRLFFGRTDVRVVEMTYNAYTNFTGVEAKTYKVAMYYFWLRFIKAAVNSIYSIAQLEEIVGKFDPDQYYDFYWSKHIILDKFNIDPFSRDDGGDYPLLIAVDEFSKLTDAAIKWPKMDRNYFIRSLQNAQRKEF